MHAGFYTQINVKCMNLQGHLNLLIHLNILTVGRCDLVALGPMRGDFDAKGVDSRSYGTRPDYSI